MARLLADGLLPALSCRQGPLILLNIAGGVAADALNALILLWREHRDLLLAPGGGRETARPTSIHVLDLDAASVAFGARALGALAAEGGLLHGLDATFHWVPYDWADTSTLRRLLAEVSEPDAVLAGSSEGGLFEYPDHDQIVDNLRVLHEGTPGDFVLVGTVIRDTTTIDPRMAPMEAMRGRPAIRFIGVDRFADLARRAGWRITAVADEAIHHVVQMRKA